MYGTLQGSSLGGATYPGWRFADPGLWYATPSGLPADRSGSSRELGRECRQRLLQPIQLLVETRQQRGGILELAAFAHRRQLLGDRLEARAADVGGRAFEPMGDAVDGLAVAVGDGGAQVRSELAGGVEEELDDLAGELRVVAAAGQGPLGVEDRGVASSSASPRRA